MLAGVLAMGTLVFGFIGLLSVFGIVVVLVGWIPVLVMFILHFASLDTIIRQHVRYVLDLNRGNKLRAARQLHISRSTLYRILGNESVLSRE